MKRMILIALVVLLLTGCAVNDPNGTGVSSQPTETQPVPTLEPGVYEPDSYVEVLTGGTVRAFPLVGRNTTSLAPMGKDILVTTFEDDRVGLTVLTGKNCAVRATVQLNCDISLGDAVFRTTDKGLCYYDAGDHSIVMMNTSLQETERIALPEDAIGSPAISQDMATVYYCTESQLRALNLETGISRLLKQQQVQWQSIRKLSFDDQILVCEVIELDEDMYTSFVSTETGQTVGVDEGLVSFESSGMDYFLLRSEGSLEERLFGKYGEQVMTLYPKDQDSTCYPLFGSNRVLSSTFLGDETLALAVYDLTSGKQTAEVTIGGVGVAYAVMEDSDGNGIWFLSYSAKTETDVLYYWDPSQDPVTDSSVMTSVRYTEDSPDEEGLGQCQRTADALGQKYGVEIIIDWTAIPQPDDYTLTGEYQTLAIQNGLQALETALSRFPEDFFTKAVEVTPSKKLRISLVREISNDVIGLQYWLDGDAYIAISIGDASEQTLYHEMSHVLDSFVLANSRIMDDWETLNPEGFAYDYNYDDYWERIDGEYLEGDTKAFIDEYSKSYPKEDRARILEYAMMPGNADLFTSKVMQSKLKMLCQSIRDAYGWKKDTRSFYWEQYLEEPLAYVKK